VKAGRMIDRSSWLTEAGRDGFWLARWLRSHGIESYVIHPTSIGVRRRTGLMRPCCCARCSAGCAASASTARWRQSRRSRKEDAKRPSRERESLVSERTRIVNRMKGALARLGIRGFKPELRKAAQHLGGLRTPENTLIPPNTLDEFRRGMARLAVIHEQIKAIEVARLEHLQQAPDSGPPAHGAPVGTGARHRRRDGGHAGPRDFSTASCATKRPSPRYAGITGSPDESGTKRREKGLAKAGQCPGAQRSDPTCLARAPLPTGQRPGAVVSRTGRRWARARPA